ncbi:GDP-mannose 4,6-dehydratase [Fusobacterium sp. MFO224]|uniref:GDP-mannose 4,6-dehydratase n=1 Tax=Fusobacterium sp. MFO224 TaxID=3378070 RepID=UPI003855281C
MKILITGGAGFIGSHLCEKLLSLGHSVINIDNFHNFYSKNIKIKNILESTDNKKYINKIQDIESLIEIVNCDSYKLYFNDIRNLEKLDDIFSLEKPELVINLAGLAGVRPSIETPLFYEEVNIKGTMNLLELCKKYHIHKFIQASSSSVYGNNTKVPFEEIDAVDFAISPYAFTKKSCEVMGHVYHKLYNIDMFQLRFFTVYGERQRPDLAIHKFINLISRDKSIEIFGDGSTYRDYTYIDDIIQGILKSIKYLISNNKVYEILNLGSSNPISLKEMILTIEKVLNKKAKINYLPMQPGDVDKTYANINKAKKLIGYEPKISFEKGIRNFVTWYKED